MNVSKSENMLIHLVFTHFITTPNKNNFNFLVAPNKKQSLFYRFFQLHLRKNNGKRLGTKQLFISHYFIHYSIHGRFFLNEMKSLFNKYRDGKRLVKLKEVK
jgi:hypothetical protein